MATLVSRLLFIYLFIFGFTFAYSQSHSSAIFYIDEYSKLGKRMDVYSFLDQAIPQPQTGCTPVWDFFYFRVRATGKVDSLYHKGNLPTEVTSKIIANIYSTNGHWKTKKKADKIEFCWFVFPYFYYGNNPYDGNCTENEKRQQNLAMDMAANILIISTLIKDKKAILLMPSENGGGIIKK